MTISFGKEFTVAKSVQKIEKNPVALENYLELIKEDLEAEIERILREKLPIGEGKAAKVFDLEKRRRHIIPVCIKIWKPELERLRETDPVEYRKRQFISPREEFNLQDDLFREGFANIPRPIIYHQLGRYHVFAMEKIDGYTLQEIMDAGAVIENPNWENLEELLKKLAFEHHVVHRDLHPGNIFLETGDSLASKKLQGSLRIIDFGLAKRIHGNPTEEDFKLTLGNHMIRYKDDRTQVEALKPRTLRSPFAT